MKVTVPLTGFSPKMIHLANSRSGRAHSQLALVLH